MVLLYLSCLLFFNLTLWVGFKGVWCQFLGPLAFDLVGDLWSLSFFSLLSLISGSVFTWSYYYMDGEPGYRRFLALVMSFVASMVVLIFMGSLFGALVGWDGLGVTSFLLVIYFKNRKSLGSGMITALTNRIGDGFLLVLLGLSLVPSYHTSYIISVLLILTAMTKSAQFPFSSWLPAAMAAPTPVSALVHSSTLVTAGIYLLMRFNHFTTEWLMVLGSVTMAMAGFCACAEMDIKKIVALSTLSQLGVMFVGLSLSLKSLCFFHLMTHAMFKALLFMCVGVGIHTVYGSQDFRSYSVLSSVSMWPSLMLTTANLALLGFPFLAGFYSKDSILESFYSMSNAWLALVVFLVGVGLTTAYSVKMSHLALVSSCNEVPTSINGGGTAWMVKAPLSTLGIFSMLGGYWLSSEYSASSPTMLSVDKLAPLSFIALGALVGHAASTLKLSFFSSMWNLTPFYQESSFTSVSMRLSQSVDGGLTESVGGPGLNSSFLMTNKMMQPALSLSLLMALCLMM